MSKNYDSDDSEAMHNSMRTRYINLTDQDNLRLVREVEKRPLLYNTSLPAYSRKPDTDEAWEEIGQIMNLSGALCKEKWKNIRVVLLRYLKAEALPSKRKKKPYYLADATKFLLPYLTHLQYYKRIAVSGASTTTAETITTPTTTKTSAITTTFPAVTTSQPSTAHGASNLTKPSTSKLEDMEIKVEPVAVVESPEHSLNMDSDLDLEIDNIDMTYGAALSQNETEMSDSSEGENKAIPRTPNDPVLSFLDCIAPELKEMTFEQFKIFKRKVFVLIDEVTTSNK